MAQKKVYPTIPVFQYGSIYPTYPLLARIPRVGKHLPVEIGSIVSWLVDSKRKGGHAPFTATGKVIRLYITTFGSTMSKEAAQVETYGEYLQIFPNRKHTTIAVDKLKIIS